MVMNARFVSLGALVATLALPMLASAQEADGFALNRFEPSVRGSDWFVGESLDFRGDMRPALGIIGDWAHKPLVLYDENGDEDTAIVEDQVYAHIGGALILSDRFRIGASLPLAVVNSGASGTTTNSSFSSNDGATVGDARISGDVRLMGEHGGAFTAAAGVQLYLPTGSRDAFSGDGKVRIHPRAMVAGDIDQFAYAGRVGVNVRTQNENFADEPFGTEMTFVASAGIRLLERKLLLGPEIYGSTVVSDSGDGAFARRTTPVEVLAQGKYDVDDEWRVGAGFAPGLTRGFGTPQFRVVASVEWFPKPDQKKAPPKPADTDGDGITDDVDACPDVPGVRSEDPKKHGCPLPADKDGDGILDPDDACPDEAGVKSDDPAKNGCPLPPDTDGDGIIDEKDACPNEAGVESDDPEKHGCPAPKDRDGDGIMNPEDACPDDPGVASEDPKKNGCPKAKIVGKKIEILERVEFDTGKATIRDTSTGVLEAVLKILKDNPGIKKLSIEGHTDNRGNRGYNRALSRRRAAAVVKWLVDRGIERGRLTSQGFGPDKPIDNNDTAEGRQNNRRVEFNIVENEGATEVESK